MAKLNQYLTIELSKLNLIALIYFYLNYLLLSLFNTK